MSTNRLPENDYLPPVVLFTAQSRERKARIYDALAVTLGAILLAALGVIAFTLAAPNAKADTISPAVLDYVDRYGAGAVCPVLDSHYTVNGMLGVLYGIEDDGFTPFEAGQIIGISVTEFCPRNQPLMRQFINVYGGQVTA